MLAGRRVNDSVVKFLVEIIINKIKKIKNKKVLLCGLTYKANVSDTRNSLALKIFENLSRKIKVDAFDPDN
jgi:UDP-N-acetyl-D-mannosaminuronate dehydrogenase